MRVCLVTFTIRELKLTPLQTLDFLVQHGLEGAQFGGLAALSPALDPGELRELRAHADRLGLYTHVSVPTCNPHLVRGNLQEHVETLKRHIALAAACGWHELHSSLGGGDERYRHAVPWTQHLADSANLIRDLGPVLRQHGSRIDLETHGDTTTFELVRLIEAVGADIAGICLDTANVFCHAEDPALAARRAAPFVHLTHTKDAIVFFIDTGYRRQTLPIGQGALDWPAILPALARHAPDLPLSIEDHKWFFDFHVFTAAWLRLHPDLTRDELALVLQTAWRCQRRLLAGELRDPDAVEKSPSLDDLETRLAAGRDYLKGLLRELGLVSPPVRG